MPRSKLFSSLAWYSLPLVACILCGAPAFAQSDIDLLNNQTELYFLLTISGTVNNVHFQNVHAVLQLTYGDILSSNPYQITIAGFPSTSGRNVFYWSSNSGPMQVYGSQIISTAPMNRLGRQAENIFYYLDPKRLKVPRTHREKELREQADRMARPAAIPIADGELKITFTGDSLDGSVRMDGRDPTTNEFVHYQATFHGVQTLERLPAK